MGSWQKFFSPLGYIGASILALIGLSPANMTQWLASQTSPEVASWISGDRGRWAFVVIAVFILAGTFRRHLARIEEQSRTGYAQRPPALSSPMMSITDIAEYLRDTSAWGCRKRGEFNIKLFVQNEISDELRRAARNGEVRFVGTTPNQAEYEEINFGYWDAATFDANGLWNSQYEFFTMGRLTSGHDNVICFRFGRAPREDVIKAWPPASLLLRISVKIILWLRWARHGFSTAWKDD